MAKFGIFLAATLFITNFLDTCLSILVSFLKQSHRLVTVSSDWSIFFALIGQPISVRDLEEEFTKSNKQQDMLHVILIQKEKLIILKVKWGASIQRIKIIIFRIWKIGSDE